MKLFFEKIGAKRILSLVLSAVMLFAIVLFASSCERGVQVQNISLNFSEINIIVGSSRMISGSDITFEPVLVRNRDFVLISGDNSIFTACNNTSSVTALRAGRARLTVQSVSNGRVAVAYVNVSDRAPEKIEVISNGEIFQSALSFSTIEFFAHLDTDLANIVMVNWRIHDIQTGVEYENITLTSYESFSFLPHRVGAFEITASVFNHFNQEISHSVRVGAFYDFVLAPQYFEHIMGELFQETRQEVSFEVDFVDAHGNPPRTIEWMVGEEVMSVERRFNFFPQQSGQFQISLYINGKRISFSTGENYALLVVEDVDGAIPTNLYLCTFRNFPYVTLYFDTSIINVDYEIRIYRETSDGARTSHAVNISTINTATQGVFQNGYADLTEFVGFNESENFHVLNTTFIVRIRTMLRGERDGISEWVEISSNPIRDYQNAIPHLKNTAFDGHQNHFVQNENDFAKLFAHFFKWREMPRLGNNVSHSQTHEMFICDDFGAPFIYPFVGDSVELTNNITSFLRHNFYALGFTGYYRIEFEFGSNNGQGRIFSLTIRFDTDGLPSFSSDIFHWPSSVGGQAPIALRALRPRVNNDFSNLRQSLPIDSSGRREVLVRTSEQLYFVLERGFRPIVERGSEA
ncbi:MAG: hypothetical protein FWC11_04350, partial [Firmicutes bacterium]|nr:hypothetical protein [Bacillota bacterium]